MWRAQSALRLFKVQAKGKGAEEVEEVDFTHSSILNDILCDIILCYIRLYDMICLYYICVRHRFEASPPQVQETDRVKDSLKV